MAAPNRVDVKVTFGCNNRCRFCVQGSKRERYRPREKAEILEVLSSKRDNYEGVVFTGGEPTLHPDILVFVESARELGYSSIQIQSNGRMFSYRSLCEALVGAGATEFSPALHGHIPELHDYLTRSPGSFQQTVQGIQNLKVLGQKVITNTVVNRSNFRNLPEIARLLVDLGADQFQFALVHPVGMAGWDQNFRPVVPRLELLEPYLHDALRIGISAGRVVMTEAIPYCFLAGFEDVVGERFIPNTCVIGADGTIEDYSNYRKEQGKTHGPPCNDCCFSDRCEGPWREYPERFGWTEFRARKQDQQEKIP